MLNDMSNNNVKTPLPVRPAGGIYKDKFQGKLNSREKLSMSLKYLKTSK